MIACLVAIRRKGANAFLIYLALSFFFLGSGLIGHFSTFYIGPGKDSPQSIWCVGWIAYALRHHLNPLVTHVIFDPQGFNLAWQTFDPLGGLLVLPLTWAWGPTVSYNLLCLLAPALAGWGAFLLCEHLTGSWWPSLTGGGLFGFSPYLLQTLYAGTLHLALVFPVPLMVYVAVRTFSGMMRRRTLTLSFAALLVAQFLFSTEIFATASMFGAMTVGLALGVLDNEGKRRVVRLLAPIGLSYLLALIILCPYIYYVVAFGIPNGPIWMTDLFVNRLLSVLFPRPLSELGHLDAVRMTFGGPHSDGLPNEGFLGPALIVILVLYGWRHLREPAGKLLIYSFVAIFVLSFGARLQVGVHGFTMLPGVLLSSLPELNKALPVRFAMYYMLAAAVMAACWLATGPATAITRCSMAVLALLPIVPVLSAGYWIQATDTPAFFAQELYRKYLKPGEIVMVLPYGWRGRSMLWQAETNMYFRMAGGYIGPPPYEYQQWPIVIALFQNAYLPDSSEQLIAFLVDHQATTVIADDQAAIYWRAMLAALDRAPIKVGGVFIYRVRPDRLAAYNSLTPLELERRAAAAKLAEELAATESYLDGGGDPATLSPQKLQQRGLIRSNWFGGPDLRISQPLWLRPAPGGLVQIGVMGSQAALDPLVASYGPLAQRVIRLPIESPFNPGGKASLQLMILVLDRASLAQASRVRIYSQS